MEYYQFEVGKPFPIAVPQVDSVTLNLSASGMAVVIQAPGLTRPELLSFKKSFKRYGYLEAGTDSVPIATWIFDFPAGPIDCTFDAHPVDPTVINDYLALEAGQVKNAWNFFLLDGQILRAMKLIGIHPDAIRLFHHTIRKQLNLSYTQLEYDQALANLYTLSTEELLKRAKVFRHRRKK